MKSARAEVQTVSAAKDALQKTLDAKQREGEQSAKTLQTQLADAEKKLAAATAQAGQQATALKQAQDQVMSANAATAAAPPAPLIKLLREQDTDLLSMDMFIFSPFP